MPVTEEKRLPRIMLIGRDRICYRGLLGRPQHRALGAFAIYIAMAGKLELRTDGNATRRGEIISVRPFDVHDVQCSTGNVIVLLIEPETVDDPALEALEQAICDPRQAAMLADRIRSGVDALAAIFEASLSSDLWDQIMLGRNLARRRIDARISRILDHLRTVPEQHIPADLCAAQAHLSVSQFLRVFKANVGSAYRAWRAWRRSREILNYVNKPTNLAMFALDSGYPDSTYFCHSTRKIWGLPPSAIFAGSRHLDIQSQRCARYIST